MLLAWLEKQYFYFSDETGGNSKVVLNVFKDSLMVHYCTFWNTSTFLLSVGIEYVSLIFKNHMLSFIGLLSKRWDSNDEIMLKKIIAFSCFYYPRILTIFHLFLFPKNLQRHVHLVSLWKNFFLNPKTNHIFEISKDWAFFWYKILCL